MKVNWKKLTDLYIDLLEKAELEKYAIKDVGTDLIGLDQELEKSEEQIYGVLASTVKLMRKDIEEVITRLSNPYEKIFDLSGMNMVCSIK